MVFGGQKRFWTVNLILETKIKVKIFILCGMQLHDHISGVFSIIAYASFFVSSYFSSPEPKANL